MDKGAVRETYDHLAPQLIPWLMDSDPWVRYNCRRHLLEADPQIDDIIRDVSSYTDGALFTMEQLIR